MTSLCCNALLEAANLRVTQQRITKQFLTEHFGGIFLESERKNI